jgi:hypothetical protein
MLLVLCIYLRRKDKSLSIILFFNLFISICTFLLLQHILRLIESYLKVAAALHRVLLTDKIFDLFGCILPIKTLTSTIISPRVRHRFYRLLRVCMARKHKSYWRRCNLLVIQFVNMWNIFYAAWAMFDSSSYGITFSLKSLFIASRNFLLPIEYQMLLWL